MIGKWLNWILFISLALIWGSSFILMKEGLIALTAVQVASLRMLSSALVLLPIFIKSFKNIPGNKLGIVFLSGLLGSLLPAYLFCIAEQSVDSALAGTLNSLTPIFVIIAGAVFFSIKTTFEKITGIAIAFVGTILLFFSQPSYNAEGNISGVLMIVLATMMYGLNVNLVQRHLGMLPSVQVVSVALVLNAVPALIVLIVSGYFQENFSQHAFQISTAFSLLLGIVGTALASILFYTLIKRAGAVFSSMVTYLIPIVANIWGLIYGEMIGWKQIFSLLIILTGVYIASRWKASWHSKG